MTSVEEARARLIGPGLPFEIEEVAIRGVPTRTWKHAPASLRSVFQAAEAYGARDFIVYQDERWSYDRHNAAVRSTVKMVKAGAIGPVIQGDKEDKAKTDMLNTMHVVDVGEIGGDAETGGDVNYEVKVPTPLKKKYSAGKGSTQGGGAPATVGHLFGFGSTEEEYRVMILGCAERGRKSDGPFD